MCNAVCTGIHVAVVSEFSRLQLHKQVGVPVNVLNIRDVY